jgi:hypothetical protein
VTEGARREYAEALRPRYEAADRRERGRILDEYCRVTRCHRKAAIRALRRRPRGRRQPGGRPRRYGADLQPVLERVWLASDRLCGKLLAAVLPTLLAALERHHGLVVGTEQRAALLAASPATLDRLLRPLRRRQRRQPYRASPAVAALRRQIPVRTWSEWRAAAPGAVQGDLVLHCGDSTAGGYLATLLAVDVVTLWTELEIVWRLGQERVGRAVHFVRQRLPMPLRLWHSDNGSEFINDELLAWCRRHAVQFTRGRPYRKNDQAWVEQRNGLVVRRLVGYDRYSSRAAFQVFQRLYPLLRLQLNFFRPVRKLLSTRRIGSRVVKRYDAPHTPYQRVVASGTLTREQHQGLEAQRQQLDPIALAHDIDATLDILWKLADTRATAPEVARG